MEDADLQQQLADLDKRIDAIEHLLRDVRDRQDAMPALPQTNLLSGSFFSRAFAVFGHYFVASLIITAPLIIVMILIAIVVGISMGG